MIRILWQDEMGFRSVFELSVSSPAKHTRWSPASPLWGVQLNVHVVSSPLDVQLPNVAPRGRLNAWIVVGAYLLLCSSVGCSSLRSTIRVRIRALIFSSVWFEWRHRHHVRKTTRTLGSHIEWYCTICGSNDLFISCHGRDCGERGGWAARSTSHWCTVRVLGTYRGCTCFRAPV